jgi:hypothetical protein
MKTIVENTTNLSKYLLNDDVTVTLNEDTIVVGDPAMFIVADLNASTVTVYEGVTAPADWIGNKYTFDGTNWTLNPDWVQPAPVEHEELSETENSE